MEGGIALLCPVCRSNNPDNAVVCVNCGALLHTGAPPLSPAGRTQAKAPRKNGLIAGLIACMAVLLAGAGVLLYLLLSNTPLFNAGAGTIAQSSEPSAALSAASETTDATPSSEASEAVPAAKLDILGNWYSPAHYRSLNFLEDGTVYMKTNLGITIQGFYTFDELSGIGTITVFYKDGSTTSTFHMVEFQSDGSSNLLIGQFWFNRQYAQLADQSDVVKNPTIYNFGFEF